MSLRLAFFLLALGLIVTSAPAFADNILYANGPVNGICDIQGCTADAWTINVGFDISDSFNISSDTTIHGFTFAVWVFPGVTVSAVDWAIGTCEECSDIAAGTANVTSTFLSTNQFAFDIWSLSVSGLDVPVDSGTYWLTLQNAVSSTGDPVYWDENNGPSDAGNGSIGSIPSESFNIFGGGGSGSVPEPSSLLLFASSIVGVGALVRRKRLL